MSRISVADVVLEGNMGDGWRDCSAAACAYAEYLEAQYLEALAPFSAAGHTVVARVDVAHNTAGCSPEPSVWVSGGESTGYDDELSPQVESAIGDVNSRAWERFCESAGAAQFAE